MAWLTGWSHRKELTVDSTKVGSGPHTNFPVAVSLNDADIISAMQPLAGDIRFTDSDGSTELDFSLHPVGHIGGKDGVWTWFNKPCAIYDSSGSGAIYWASQVTDLDADDGYVWKYDIGTGETSRSIRAGGHGDDGDDHNNPALVQRSDGKIIAFCPSHTTTRTTIRYFISSSARDITAWDSVKNITFSTSGVPAYSQAWRLSSESSGQKIWHFSRFATGGNRAWYYSTSTNDGDTFSTPALFWDTSDDFPYLLSSSNGSDRMDFLVTDDHPNQSPSENQKIYHFYYDGNWRNSDASLINSGSIPAGGITPSDLNSSSTVLDSSAGSDSNWIASLDYDSSGSPVALLTVFKADVAATQEHHWAEYSSGWSTEKITDSPQLTDGTDEPYYSPIGCIDVERTQSVYIGVDVSGVTEIQRWEKDGTWAKAEDITSGSSTKNFRPLNTHDHPGGTTGGAVMWCQGDYENYLFPDMDTGIRIYPPLDGYRATVEIPSLSSSADTSFYVYYGNAAASTASNPANTYANGLAFPELAGSPKDPTFLRDEFVGSDYVVDEGFEHINDISSEVPMLQASNSLNTYGFFEGGRRLEGPSLDLSSLTAVTVELFFKWAAVTGDENTLISNMKGAGSQAGFLIRLEPSGDLLEVFFDASTGRLSGSSASNTAPHATDTYLRVVFDGDVAGSTKIYIQTDTNTEDEVYSGSGSTMNATASAVALCLFDWIEQGSYLDQLESGAIGEARIWSEAKSQGWGDTTYNNFKTAGFYSLGVEEDEGSTAVEIDSMSHSVTIDGATLTQANVLAAQGIGHSQSVDGVSLAQANELEANSVEQGQAVDNGTLTQANAIAPNSMSQGQSMDSVTLTQAHVLAPNSITQGQSIDAITLLVGGTLDIQSIAQSQAIDEALLTVAGVLNVQGVSQAQTLEALELVQANVLAPNGITQSQSIDSATLAAASQSISMDDVSHSQTLDATALTQYHVLSVDGLTQAQAIDVCLFGGLVIGELNGQIVIYAAMGGTVYAIPALSGTIH